MNWQRIICWILKPARQITRLHEEVESLSSENIRLQNLVKDLSDWNDKLRERLSYREAYPDNFLKEPEQEPVAIVSGYYGGQCVILPMQPDRILNSGTIFYTFPPTLSLAQRIVLPDAITDDSESPEYRTGWNECCEVMRGMMK